MPPDLALFYAVIYTTNPIVPVTVAMDSALPFIGALDNQGKGTTITDLGAEEIEKNIRRPFSREKKGSASSPRKKK